MKKSLGGTKAIIGEGRFDEAVLPLPNGINDFVNSFKMAQGGQVNNALKSLAGVGVHSQNTTTIHEHHYHNLTIENAIGEKKWFDQNLKEWKETTYTNSNKARGVTNRTVESYKSGNQRTIR